METLLFTRSAFGADEYETRIHDQEFENLMDQVFELPDYKVELDVTFLDEYHKEHDYPLFYESHLHNVFDFMESRDIKNGIDMYLDEEQNLFFVAYGQGYHANGKDGTITTKVLVKAFDEDGKIVPMTSIKGFNKGVKK